MKEKEGVRLWKNNHGSGYTTNTLVGRPLEWTDENLTIAARKFLNWFLESSENIFISDFEKEYSDINTDVFKPSNQRFQECENEEFHALVKKARDAQEDNVLKSAWDKPARTGIAAFWLKNKRNWKDNVEHQHTSAVPFNINFTLLSGSKTPELPPQIIIEPILPKLIEPPEEIS